MPVLIHLPLFPARTGRTRRSSRVTCPRYAGICSTSNSSPSGALAAGGGSGAWAILLSVRSQAGWASWVETRDMLRATMSTAAACLQSMATGQEQTPRWAVKPPETD